MPRAHHSHKPFMPRLAFALMAMLLIMLWISGGASRADVIGQVIARAAAWGILLVFILFAPRPRLRPVAPVAFFVLTSTALVALQLIPLPPSIWTSLPGRDMLEQAAIASGQEQPWRPMSISPGATLNALSSLIVPVSAILMMATISVTEQWRVSTLLLVLVVASSLLGLLQFSGIIFDHPMINDIPGAVSASFANRNHFALFVAIGCVLVPNWAFREGPRARWKGPVAVALLLLFVLIILATGSRTGILLGVLGVSLGLLSVRRTIASELRRLPKPIWIALVAACVTLLVAAVVLSMTVGRAVSLDRVLALDIGDDLRRQALPTVLAMTWLYFPVGTGIGTFDPAYRIHELNALLNIGYFNHAHNDLLEIVLDAGLAGLLLLVTAILWWLWKSWQAWRPDGSHNLLPRIGSGILLLILLASVTDYPARTPMMMAVIVIAAVWLQGSERQGGSSAASRLSEHERVAERSSAGAANTQ